MPAWMNRLPTCRARAAAPSATGAAASKARRGSACWTSGRATASPCRRCAPRYRSTPHGGSSPATSRRTSPSTARSTPIAAASTAASTASRGRRTPISACRPASTSRPGCSPSRTRPSCCERELARPGYGAAPIAMGTNTDPYQPIEREHRITREILEVLRDFQPSGRHRHQVGADRARHRHPGADGGAGLASGLRLGDHARPRAGAAHGAACADAGAAARGDPRR